MDELKRKQGHFNSISKGLRYFGFLMIFFYFAVGLLFIFSDLFSNIINNRLIRYCLGILFVIYAVFRTFRIIKIIKDEND